MSKQHVIEDWERHGNALIAERELRGRSDTAHVSSVTPESRARGNAWLKAWAKLAPEQQAKWHALDRATKDESYKWTAEQLIAFATGK